jgi:hypothetical protein
MSDPTPEQTAELRESVIRAIRDNRGLMNGATGLYARPKPWVDFLVSFIEQERQQAAERADREAMLREATHRANDALDRLLRIDRERCIAHLAEYLDALQGSNTKKGKE